MTHQIQTELRGVFIQGTATTADAIALSVLFMVPSELEVLRDPDQPNTLLAIEMMKARLSIRLEMLANEVGMEKANEIIAQEWVERIAVVCEMDLSIRTLVLSRLLEIYPSLRKKPKWIWFDGNVSGHRLELDELVFDLIIPAFETLMDSEEEKRIDERNSRRGKRLQTIAEAIGGGTTIRQKSGYGAEEYPGEKAEEAKPEFDNNVDPDPDPDPEEAISDNPSTTPTGRAQLLQDLRARGIIN